MYCAVRYITEMWLSGRGGSVDTSEHSLATGRNERSSSLPRRAQYLNKVSNSFHEEKYCNFLLAMTSAGYYG